MTLAPVLYSGCLPPQNRFGDTLQGACFATRGPSSWDRFVRIDARWKARTSANAEFMGHRDSCPLERLALSPQCGFASTREGNLLAEAGQEDKLRLVAETAREVWAKASDAIYSNIQGKSV